MRRRRIRWPDVLWIRLDLTHPAAPRLIGVFRTWHERYAEGGVFSINAARNGRQAVVKVVKATGQLLTDERLDRIEGAVLGVYRRPQLDQVRAIVSDPRWLPDDPGP